MNGTKKLRVAHGEKLSLPLLVGILASFGDDSVNTCITPMLASISESFPDISYSMITWLYTMPKIVIIPFALISGYLLSKNFGFKRLALIGLGVITIAGSVPFFLDSFWVILASRMVFAIGLGLQSPIGPALVMRFCKSSESRSHVLGLGNCVLNFFGIITGLLVGNLCTVGWRFGFLAYLGTGVLFLVTALWLKEPPISFNSNEQILKGTSQVLQSETHFQGNEIGSKCRARQAHKGRLPLKVAVVCAIIMFVDCLWMAGALNVSPILVENGWGDSATAAVLISLINIAGLTSGLSYGFFFKESGKFGIPISFVVMAGGLACMNFASSIAMMGIGLFIGGFAFCLIICGLQNVLGDVCLPEQMGLASALFMVFENIGGFLTSGYLFGVMGLFGQTAYMAPVGVSALLFAVAGIVAFLIVLLSGSRTYKKRSNDE